MIDGGLQNYLIEEKLLNFIATFFLIISSMLIVATYMRFRTPQPEPGISSGTSAIPAFGLAFAMLALAGMLVF